jgi:uncharacterized membrane protein
MKPMRVRVIAVVFLVLTSCENKSNPADESKPAKSKPAAKGVFTVTGTSEPVEGLNGKEVKLDAELKWVSGPFEEVQLKTLFPSDKGVTAVVDPTTVKAVEAEKIRVVVTVGEATPAGDYQVTVVGKAANAGQASHTFTIRVPKKE